MQQTALNLIAIGVFTITISSLLGPIFNISPTIPAAATVAIMGLVGVDTIAWQNRGITLLLDRFTSLTERERIIHHEAGHFLVAYLLEIPVTGYSLTAWEAWRQGQPGLGGVILDTESLSTVASKEMPLIVERLCTVQMAGIAAEKLIYGNVTGGADDRQKLTEIFAASNLPPSAYQQKQRWGLLQASNLIEKHLEAYEALVKAMQERLSVGECFDTLSNESRRA